MKKLITNKFILLTLLIVSHILLSNAWAVHTDMTSTLNTGLIIVGQLGWIFVAAIYIMSAGGFIYGLINMFQQEDAHAQGATNKKRHAALIMIVSLVAFSFTGLTQIIGGTATGDNTTKGANVFDDYYKLP